MQSNSMNIYRTARRLSGFTREKAAELLFISVRSIAEYEAGRTIPNDETVCRMIDTYGTHWLGYEHLKRSTEVGRRYLPEINITDLAKSVLRLQKEVSDVNLINSDMVEVACDGVVHDHELEKWENVQKEISEMAAAAMAVLFSHQKEKALV